MESLVQRKIRCRSNMVEHLKQMNYLSNIPIHEDDLLSIEKTDFIFKEYKENNFRSSKILFEFDSSIIRKIKDELLEFDFSFYLISEFSFDSGLLFIETVNQFNSAFDFFNLGFYRVSLLETNLENEITFWEEDNNELEIEIKGDFFINHFMDKLSQ